MYLQSMGTQVPLNQLVGSCNVVLCYFKYMVLRCSSLQLKLQAKCSADTIKPFCTIAMICCQFYISSTIVVVSDEVCNVRASSVHLSDVALGLT